MLEVPNKTNEIRVGHLGGADPAATPDLDGRRSDATRGAGALLEGSAVAVSCDQDVEKRRFK